MRCTRRLADHSWSYTYGLERRGVSPRTGKVDSRPLGTDTVSLCRRCEWHLLRASLRGVLGETPAVLAFNLFSMATIFLSAAYAAEAIFGYGTVVGLGVLWAVAAFALRRPKAMRRGAFLMRRGELAALHGVPSASLEIYPGGSA